MEKFSIPSGTLTLVVIHATFLMFSLHFAKLSNFHQDISISMIKFYSRDLPRRCVAVHKVSPPPPLVPVESTSLC